MLKVSDLWSLNELIQKKLQRAWIQTKQIENVPSLFLNPFLLNCEHRLQRNKERRFSIVNIRLDFDYLWKDFNWTFDIFVKFLPNSIFYTGYLMLRLKPYWNYILLFLSLWLSLILIKNCQNLHQRNVNLKFFYAFDWNWCF